ncbi:hypothetical protein PR048_026450 [Dryococelus australis]|uniref:Endonuclease/exonuclease/phosphatase domain-containing protein n=1 Tax=Dryococelus australis TaxID=614101 RepID=A0ABQ9GLE0_9NEOP|nr:hypothetical protein PR048_026450 [Dryococelus australis]
MLIEDTDIALITETRLNPTKRQSLPNYSIYRTDRQDSTGGGTAKFIKYNIKHRPLGSKGESSIIIIPTQMGEMTMAAHYSPPNHKDFAENIQHIMKQAPNFFIGGDFNCRSPSWGCKTYKKIKINICYPPEQTFYPKNITFIPSFLNLFFTNLFIIIDLEVRHELSSDHLPAVATINLPNSKQVFNKPLLEADWELFKTEMEAEYPVLQDQEIEDINMEADIISDTTMLHIKKSTKAKQTNPSIQE